MSASREKKARQGLGAGYVSPQAEKERKEKASIHRTTIIFAVCVALFLLFAAAMLLWNSNVIQRKASAVKVNGETYSTADLAYFYYSSRFNLLNQYSGQIDSSKSLREQDYPDGSQTWYDYNLSVAVDTLSKAAIAAKAAKDSNFDDGGEVDKTVAETMEYVSQSASQNGYTVAQYLKAVYGPLMTRSVFERNLRMQTLASLYTANLSSASSYSDAELQAVYDADPDAYAIAYYESILFFSGNYMSNEELNAAEGETGDSNTAEGETGDSNTAEGEAGDSNTTEGETDDSNAAEGETSAANAAAAADAALALSRIQAGESMEAIATDLNATYTNSSRYYGNDDTLNKWLFDAARYEGETAVLDYYGSGSLVVVFHGKQRADFHNVDVRHILVSDEETAKSLLDQFNAGDKSEESFAQLAMANTIDQGSAENGGLYTGVSIGQMVKPFEEWCFDASRKSGDVGIVQTQYGYHVMYFVKHDEYACWQQLVAEKLGEQKTNELLADLQTELLEKGLRYIDPVR